MGLLQDEYLFFYITDATGHGKRGAKFWDDYKEPFDNLWNQFVNTVPDAEKLEKFAKQVNDLVYGSNSSQNQICIAIGVLNKNSTFLWG